GPTSTFLILVVSQLQDNSGGRLALFVSKRSRNSAKNLIFLHRDSKSGNRWRTYRFGKVRALSTPVKTAYRLFESSENVSTGLRTQLHTRFMNLL
ncbi:hypothetical protein, partial [Cupriavidus numazuensis]